MTEERDAPPVHHGAGLVAHRHTATIVHEGEKALKLASIRAGDRHRSVDRHRHLRCVHRRQVDGRPIDVGTVVGDSVFERRVVRERGREPLCRREREGAQEVFEQAGLVRDRAERVEQFVPEHRIGRELRFRMFVGDLGQTARNAPTTRASFAGSSVTIVRDSAEETGRSTGRRGGRRARTRSSAGALLRMERVVHERWRRAVVRLVRARRSLSNRRAYRRIPASLRRARPSWSRVDRRCSGRTAGACSR